MAEEALATEVESPEIDMEQLEKSWASSVEEFRSVLQKSDDDSESEGNTQKARRAYDDDDDEDDEDEDEDEGDSRKSMGHKGAYDDGRVGSDGLREDAGTGVNEADFDKKGKGRNKNYASKKNLTKSLEEHIADQDDEAEIAMDVEPFLKSIPNGVQAYINQELGSLRKAVKDLTSLVSAQGKMVIAQNELTKATQEQVEQIGSQPRPSASQLRKGAGRFGPQPLEKSVILNKTREAVMKKSIDPLLATKIEGRVNAGVDLDPEWLTAIGAGEETS